LFQLKICSDLEILKNIKNGKCEKETAKKQIAKKKKKKKQAYAKWVKPTTSQNVNILKEETRGNSLMGEAQKQSRVCGAGFPPIGV
jgi:hypothetical protein